VFITTSQSFSKSSGLFGSPIKVPPPERKCRNLLHIVPTRIHLETQESTQAVEI